MVSSCSASMEICHASSRLAFSKGTNFALASAAASSASCARRFTAAKDAVERFAESDLSVSNSAVRRFISSSLDATSVLDGAAASDAFVFACSFAHASKRSKRALMSSESCVGAGAGDASSASSPMNMPMSMPKPACSSFAFFDALFSSASEDTRNRRMMAKSRSRDDVDVTSLGFASSTVCVNIDFMDTWRAGSGSG